MTQQHTHHQAPNAIHVQKFLGGLDYPVDKQALLNQAKKKGADKETLDALQKLPDREYDSPVAVSREVSKGG